MEPKKITVLITPSPPTSRSCEMNMLHLRLTDWFFETGSDPSPRVCKKRDMATLHEKEMALEAVRVPFAKTLADVNTVNSTMRTNEDIVTLDVGGTYQSGPKFLTQPFTSDFLYLLLN